jgi:hypothetical protein
MAQPETRFQQTDGLVTNERSLILTTLHADCAPVFFADPDNQAIGLAHAGRRGIVAGMGGEMVRFMAREFASQPHRLVVAVGPTISAAAYDVSDETAQEFIARFGPKVVTGQSGRPHLDLVAALTLDLVSAGIELEKLNAGPPCTFLDLTYASYRREGFPINSMLAWLVVK